MIYTFGCSLSYGANGTQTDTVSWPEKLAELLPDHTIEDFSFPGTSLEYSVFQLNRLLSQRTSEDIFVFQATCPYRYTHWLDNSLSDVNLRYAKSHNYNKYSREAGKHIQRYGAGEAIILDQGASGTINPDAGFKKLRYLYHNDELEFSNYYSLLELLRHRTDVLFKWTPYLNMLKQQNLVSHKHIQSVQESMPIEQYREFVADSSDHFGEAGSQWVAEWVLNQLKLQGKL